MNSAPQTLADLRSHQAICRELLALAERESLALRQDQPDALHEIYRLKRLLLPHLHESLGKIRCLRSAWQSLPPAGRSAQPETQFLIRQVQDLIMRIILLDRENEQSLLRRGLIPAREMAAASRQPAHFVSDLYRRHA
ncbi:MAG TPA: hypothetical protein VNU68_26900 [Verrucomicrobiae bacterium]|jgi:hypothetical protein|nr:hypothetical protein [Verrucomicrobiae bacterium]